MNYFDITVLIILLIAFYGGFKNGLIKSILSTIGYIAGGVLGLAAAVNYLSTWQSELQKVGLSLLAIFLGATLGEFLLSKIGSVFRKALFVPPFKFIDSLLGAVISLIRTAFILSLVISLLVFSRWSFAQQYVSTSYSFQLLEMQFPLILENINKYLS